MDTRGCYGCYVMFTSTETSGKNKTIQTLTFKETQCFSICTQPISFLCHSANLRHLFY